MSELILKIKGNSEAFLKHVNDVRSYAEPIDKIILDFNNEEFIIVSRFAITACVVEEFYRKDPSLKIEIINTSESVNKYIKNIRFAEYWDKGFERNRYTQTSITTALCLWNIDQEMIDEYANYTQKYFESNCPGKSLDSLSLAQKEIFNNIFDHAKSNIEGYVITQRYPKRKYIETVICDFGVGIPTSINEYWNKIHGTELKETRALLEAMKRAVSAESTPQNRGFGLANLMDIVTGFKGELVIQSNKAILKVKSDGKKHIDKSTVNFKGTVIYIKLFEDNLPIAEEVIIEDEFTF